MEQLVLSVLVILIIFVGLLQWQVPRSRWEASETTCTEFKKFQKTYFIPYLLALFADWLQGPYVYQLYNYYGYTPSQIATLYTIGFAASVTFGTCTGPLADRLGRKRLCLIFSVLYSFCCLTKLSSNFWWLAAGRVFGGISTSILNSTFESWYVCQHAESRKYPPEWISNTFSVTTFWNGVLAIIAGILSDLGAEWLSLGPVAPFLLAVPCLVFCGLFLWNNWEENYGSREAHFTSSCLEGIRVIFRSRATFLLGLTQSMFESIMYIFVFLWTPMLNPVQSASTTERWPLGLVFSCFMVCIMIGSSIHTALVNRSVHSTRILYMAMLSSFFSMLVCSWSSSSPSPVASTASFLSFLVLETAVGMYFPSIGYLKSQVIPESLRANIMNWFRVPTNIITCVVLTAKSGATQSVFLFCCFMAVTGLIACTAFTERYLKVAVDGQHAVEKECEEGKTQRNSLS